jgi:hypothetical protein
MKSFSYSFLRPYSHYIWLLGSGDWWTGPSIFAAKHLQPDFVKSIPIPEEFDPSKYFSEDEDDENHMSWEEKQQLLHQIYDEGKFPSHLLPTNSEKKDSDAS